MKANHILIVAAAFTLIASVGCRSHQEHGHDHDHDASLHLTAYNEDLEVFAEVEPLAVGNESAVAAHLTRLDNFKPFSGGRVTLTLTVGGKSQSWTQEAPVREGIYMFDITPERAGDGEVRFEVETADSISTLIADASVFDDLHEAEHAAEDAEVTSANGVEFTKEMGWEVDFSTAPVLCEPFGQVIRAMAQVQPTEGDEQILSAKGSGIVRIPGGTLPEGKAVGAGQTLLVLESGTVGNSDLSVQYAKAESDYMLAKAEYERKQTLASDKIVSEAELQKAEADYEQAKVIYDNLRRHTSAGNQAIKAPSGGYIGHLLVRSGQFVDAGAPLVTIVRNREIILKAEVQPRYYPLLGEVTTATVRSPGSNEAVTLESLGGKMLSYGHSVDTGHPLIPITFSVNRDGRLVPGTFVEMFLRTRSETPVLTIPKESVLEEMGNYFVYVQLTPEYFEKREVQTGRTDGIRTEILSGLSDGERVVAKGAVLVKVTQAAGGLDAESGHHH
ncbi:MAG: efflux RND transporter periplasmic adaptor subunit [Bacteroidales bacterium]|nr:efflux RND transporter periplasmic adaptor subunit [Bacteroidales bacterium]